MASGKKAGEYSDGYDAALFGAEQENLATGETGTGLYKVVVYFKRDVSVNTKDEL